MNCQIKVVDYVDIKDKKDFFIFCKTSSLTSKDPAAKNMWHEDWKNHPETILYLLEIKKEFSNSNGKFFVVYIDDTIIGCSGIYKSYFDNKIGIAGVRTWIDNVHRNKNIVREYLLPAQKKWAIENSLYAVVISFNEYNKNLLKAFSRKRLGENRSPRQPYHLFYNNFNELSFPVNIKYTKQWIAYEILNLEFNFDWNTIMWNAQEST